MTPQEKKAAAATATQSLLQHESYHPGSARSRSIDLLMGGLLLEYFSSLLPDWQRRDALRAVDALIRLKADRGLFAEEDARG